MGTIIINVIIKHWSEKPGQLKEVITHEKIGLLINCSTLVIYKSIEDVAPVKTKSVKIEKAKIIISTIS